jgi:hypothetical protein
MFKPGLIAVSGTLVVALSGCGMFDGVDSVVKNLSSAADKNEGSYRQPLSIPPEYNLRPPPNRKSKNVAPSAAKTETKEKKPEELDTAPVTASKTDTKKSQPQAREKAPRKLVIDVPDKPSTEDTKKVPAKTEIKKKRVVVSAPPPPQPSETSGKIKPETRGKETTTQDTPSKGEDELLRKSGVKP